MRKRREKEFDRKGKANTRKNNGLRESKREGREREKIREIGEREYERK